MKKNLTGCLKVVGLIFIGIIIIVALMSKFEDSGSHQQVASKPRMTKQQSEKQSAKKQIQKNLKEHITQLKNDLKAVPAKSKGTIQSIDVDTADSAVTVTLSDSVATTRDNAEAAWSAIRTIVHHDGPYPDDSFDQSNPRVYVDDSNGNEIGETGVFSGNFKYEG